MESAQGKIPYSALSIVIFSPFKKEKGLLIMHQDVEALYHAMHHLSHPQRPNPRLLS
jgi:hypothetical protein